MQASKQLRAPQQLLFPVFLLWCPSQGSSTSLQFPHRYVHYQRKTAVPLKEQSSRPVNEDIMYSESSYTHFFLNTVWSDLRWSPKEHRMCWHNGHHRQRRLNRPRRQRMPGNI